MNPKNQEAILQSKLAIFDAETWITDLEKKIEASKRLKEQAEKHHAILLELIGKIDEIPETLRPFAFVDRNFSADQPRIRIVAPGLTEIRYLSHMSPIAQWYYAYRPGNPDSGSCCDSFDAAFTNARRCAQMEAQVKAKEDLPF